MGCPDFSELKNAVSIVDVAESSGLTLVRVGGNTYQDKNNRSLTFYADTNRFKDFGGDGASGDVADFICRVEGCSIKEAKEKLLSFIGNTSRVKPVKMEAQRVTADYDQPEIVEREWAGFESLTFSNPAHRAELLAIAPKWAYDNADNESVLEFLRVAKFCPKSKSLVIASLNDSGQIVSYRTRKGNKSKWQVRAKTPANAYAYARITEDSKKPIYILEGQHDHLTAVLLGIDFIALPSAGYKLRELDISLLQDRKVFFIADVDSGAGLRCMERVSEAVKNVITFGLIVDLRRFLYAMGVFSRAEKLDFSDAVELCDVPDFVYQLEGFCDTEIEFAISGQILKNYTYLRV